MISVLNEFLEALLGHSFRLNSKESHGMDGKACWQRVLKDCCQPCLGICKDSMSPRAMRAHAQGFDAVEEAKSECIATAVRARAGPLVWSICRMLLRRIRSVPSFLTKRPTLRDELEEPGRYAFPCLPMVAVRSTRQDVTPVDWLLGVSFDPVDHSRRVAADPWYSEGTHR